MMSIVCGMKAQKVKKKGVKKWILLSSVNRAINKIYLTRIEELTTTFNLKNQSLCQQIKSGRLFLSILKKIFEDVSVQWSSLIKSASPFLSYQRNENHFDFFGLDIVCDQSGRCWLLEVNRYVLLSTYSSVRALLFLLLFLLLFSLFLLLLFLF